MSKGGFFVLLIFCVLGPLGLLAQENFLKKNISISLKDARIDDALLVISESGNFNFSYNAGSIKSDSLISLEMNNGTVKEALDKIFDNRAEYHVTGSHLIIRTKKRYSAPIKKDHYSITGYVHNHLTGEKIPLVSVYEVNSLASAVTNDDGYFSLTVSSDRNFLGLAVSKERFMDTVIIIQPKDYTLNIYIKPGIEKYAPIPHKVEPESPPQIEELRIVQRLVNEEQRSQAKNIKAFLHMPMQISLIPSISTNTGMSGAVENSVSINIFAGYSKGLKGVEVGGWFNILRNDMTGLQLAGLGNFVGGNIKGIQGSGIYNHVMGTSNGLQIAGITNINHQNLKGVQVAGIVNHVHQDVEGLQVAGIGNSTFEGVDGFQVSGIYNFARKDVNLFQVTGIINSSTNVKGFQIAGIANQAKNVDGFQTAGIVNVARDSVGGFQFGGIANYAHHYSGFQGAGIVNFGRKTSRGQVAGIMNIATNEVKGVQAAGILNYTKKMMGSQIGLINISDTLSGVPIGLLSFVRKGYRDVELGMNDMRLANVTFRTGVSRFYNVLTIGSSVEEFKTFHMLGFGIGKRFNESRKVALSIEGMQQVLLKRIDENNRFGQLSKASFNAHFFNRKRFSFVIGPSLNFLLSDLADNESTSSLSDAVPFSILKNKTNNHQVDFWVGLNIGIRYRMGS